MNQVAAVAAAPLPALTKVATYERVSSEDQRQRETIKSQTEALALRLACDPSVELVERYVDDGVSGTIPMAERPGGRRLLADARRGVFQELWLYRIDRLGRDWVDPQVVWEELTRYGVTVYSIAEGRLSRFIFTVYAGMAAQERETFLDRTAGGLDRACREGRYYGGVVPLGYRVEGERPQAHLVPDDTIIWGDSTAAEVVIRIFEKLAYDKVSCRGIADEYNDLRIPTAAKRPGQGNRWLKTQGLWRPNRISNLVHSPIYRGVLEYRRRIDKKKQPVRLRPIVSTYIPELALVSDEVWFAAQATLTENRICAKNTKKTYLLRSVMVCGCCGLTYVGTTAHDDTWYRCNGYLVSRGPIQGRCPSKAVKGTTIEPQIWADIEAFLRHPGELLAELDEESGKHESQVASQKQQDTLRAGLEDNTLQRTRLLDFAQNGFIEKPELRERLDGLASQRKAFEERLSALEPATEAPKDSGAMDTLARLLARLDEGLSDEERSEIVRLLVQRIVIHTEMGPDGKKRARAVVEYRFPKPREGDVCVVSFINVTGSWQNYTHLRRVIELPVGRQRQKER